MDGVDTQWSGCMWIQRGIKMTKRLAATPMCVLIQHQDITNWNVEWLIGTLGKCSSLPSDPSPQVRRRLRHPKAFKGSDLRLCFFWLNIFMSFVRCNHTRKQCCFKNTRYWLSPYWICEFYIMNFVLHRFLFVGILIA